MGNRKAPYRDYATAAFRFLALEGSVEKYKARIYNEALERTENYARIKGSISAPTEAAVMRAQIALDQVQAEIADLEAAEWTLNTLSKMGKGRTACRSIRQVYMTKPDEPLEKGDIEYRVHAVSLDIPACERSVYGWLRDGCALFAERRGLRS